MKTQTNSKAQGEPVDWEAKYQDGQTPWDRGTSNPALIQWLADGKLPFGRALVPGCGRGYEVVELADAGWEVTAIDSAPSAVEHLQATLASKNLQATIEQADLFDWEPKGGPFDLIYEQTCLCALAPERWQEYVDRLRQWLRPGGTLAALFMQTGKVGGPPYDCPLPAMRELFPEQIWVWKEDQFLLSPHPAGVEEKGVLLASGQYE